MPENKQPTETRHGIEYKTLKTEEEFVAKEFADDISEHRLQILHDDGLYRHLLFRKPGTSMYWFELVTWPGHLSISGDMGTYVFAREQDMIPFFAIKPGRVNWSYWKEKVQAGEVTELSLDQYKQDIAEQLDFWVEDMRDEDASQVQVDALIDAVNSDLLAFCDDAPESELYQRLDDFVHEKFEFYEIGDWNLQRPTFHYLWCCHAIAWGVNQFLATKEQQEPAPVAA